MILQQRQLQNSLGVTPAKAGVQEYVKKLDSRFRGNDNLGLMHLAQRIVIAGLLLLGMPVAPYADAAELLSQLHPYISVKEEYSDNLDLTSENKREDFITTVQPGIRFSNMDERGGVDLDYALGAVFYGKDSDLNYISHNASLNAKYMTSEHINFYLKESFIRSDDPREQEYFTTTADNRYVLATKTERSVYWRNVVAPTIEYQFGSENRVGLNYRNNLYRSESDSGEDSQENYINPFFTYWFDKRNGIYLEYGLTYGDFDKDPDLTGHRLNGRYTNRFSARSSAFVEFTYSKRTYDTPDSQPSDDYDIYEPYVGMTFAFSPTLNGSVQVGYFWKESETGPKKDGFSYKGQLANVDPRTTYQVSFEGGYKEDLFTADNLGFNLYHRVTGSVNHRLDQRTSIGCFASAESAEFDAPEHKDTIWGVGGRASYMPLKWLTLSFEVSHRETNSDVDTYEYKENRGMLSLTATY